MDKNRESLAEFLGRHPGIVMAYYGSRGWHSLQAGALLRRLRTYYPLPESVSAAGFDGWRAA